MNIGKFLLETVKARIVALRSQIFLIDKQLAILPLSTTLNTKKHFQIILEKNLKLTTYNAFLQYYNSMSQLTLSAFQLQQVVSSHLYAMNLAPLQILLQELYGHKQALATFLSTKSKCNSSSSKSCSIEDEPSIDDSVNFILTIFPFEISVHLLSNSSFFSFLLKTVLNYNPQKHKNIVFSVFKKIEDFFKSHPLSSKSIYYRHQNPLCYILAEHFVSVFINRKCTNSLQDFSTAEKCALIAQNGCQICQLKLSLIENIQNISSSSSTNQSADDTEDNLNTLILSSNNLSSDGYYAFDLTTFSSSSSIDPSSSQNIYFDEENDEMDTSIIPALRYSIYEIRKIPLQPSPSEMLYILSKAIDSIQFILASANGGMIGADETFPFIIYCLSVARLNRLPSIIEYIEKYSDYSLRETKFFYYIQHLRSSLSFIDDQKLQESPFYIFPFSKPPTHLEKTLIRVKESKPVSLKGFSIYAFPLWQSNIPFPSLFHYSGGKEKSIGYQYKIADDAIFDIPNQFKAIRTVNGTFLQIMDSFIESNSLIKVDSGDYDASIDDIEVVSSMIAMNFSVSNNDKVLMKPSTSMKADLYEKCIKKQWSMKRDKKGRNETESDIAVKSAIAEVQIALVILEFLPSNFVVDGNLNYMTIEAIKKLINIKDSRSNNIKDFIHPKVFYRIISEMKRKNMGMA